ncbi:MAG: type II secretion system protein [Candidatus Omnitrophota bacterium]
MKKGLTLIEGMVVILIFGFLFSAILTVLTTSDRSWRIGQNKLTAQQEARKAMDIIVKALRKSKPDWVTISTEDYPSCNKSFDKILIYEAVLNEATGELTPGPWTVFKVNPDDCTQLRKLSQADAGWAVIASAMDSMAFYGGDCVSCGCDFSKPECLNCKTISDNCPLVKVDIKTKKEQEFNLSSYVTIRNYNISSSQVPEPLPEGVF